MKEWILACVLALLGAAWACDALAAGEIEVSAGFNFNHSNYSDGNYSWTRRWGASVSYSLTETGQIEIAFQDSVDRNMIVNYEDTTFHDQVYSANWVQGLLGKKHPIQPYFKAGIGQLNREATGSYFGGLSHPPAIEDTVTGILGVGMRIFVTRSIALRAEGTTYLTGAHISTWKDNFGVTFGLSWVM